MKKISPILFVCLIFFSVVSCRHDWCVDGRGPVITKTINLSSFNKIHFSSIGNVEIIQSSEHKIVIEAEENIVDSYPCIVSDGKLYIKGDRCFSPHVTPVLYVYCTNINEVELSGSGNIKTSDTLITGDLSIRISGSGDIGLYGVKANTCNVKISGSGNCEVSVSKDLDVKISGSGNIYYKGYPAIHENISGSGNVISRN